MIQAGSVSNLFTLCNLLFGLGSIFTVVRLAADQGGSVSKAAWFIVIAAIFDALDGKVARRFNYQSRLGMELDSLADVVSFGVAPAVLLYYLHFVHWGTRGPLWGLLGLLFAALPLLFGAFRLARYNVETGIESEKSVHFSGLPIPAAAVFLSSFVLFNFDLFGELRLTGLLVPLVVVTSLLMASRVRFGGMPLLTFRESGRNRGKLLLLVLTAGSLIWFQSRLLFPVALAFVLVSIAGRARELLTGEDMDEDETADEPPLA